jgi:hypothetical protein
MARKREPRDEGGWTIKAYMPPPQPLTMGQWVYNFLLIAIPLFWLPILAVDAFYNVKSRFRKKPPQ